MKYIKSFKLYEGKQTIYPIGLGYVDVSNVLSASELDVKDITLELSDGPFEISHFKNQKGQSWGYSIMVIERSVPDYESYTMLDSFKYEEVKSTMDRLLEYLGDKSQRIEVTYISIKNGDIYTDYEIVSQDMIFEYKDFHSISEILGDKDIRRLKLFYSNEVPKEV